MPRVLSRIAAHEPPDVFVEAAASLLDTQECFGVLNRRGDFEPVANNARVGEESLYFSRVVTSDLLRVEIVEDPAVMLPFLQDRVPTQAGLGAFENEELEQGPVVVHWHAPFLVVVTDGEFVSGPGATDRNHPSFHTRHPLRYSVRKYWFASGALVIFSFFASQRIFLPARRATLPSNTASVSEPA